MVSKILADKGLSRRAVALKMTFSRPYVSMVCSGRRVPRDEFLDQLAYVLTLPDAVLKELKLQREIALASLGKATRAAHPRRLQATSEKVTAALWSYFEKEEGVTFSEEVWQNAADLIHDVLRKNVNMKGPA